MLIKSTLCLAISLGLSTIATAQTEPTELQLLRQQIAQLSQRIEQLEATNTIREVAPAQRLSAAAPAEIAPAQLPAKKPDTATGSNSAPDNRITWKGDFRYRHEIIDEEDRSTRNRQRIRARPSLVAKVNDKVKVGFGLATGSADPVSSNQTLGGAGSSKQTQVDLAYFDLAATDTMNVVGGKFKNPFYKPGGSSLLWDGDWRPEGMSASYSNGRWFGTALGTWLESDTKKDEEFAFGVQAGLKLDLGSGMKLTSGLGYLNAPLQGHEPLFDPDDSFGNSLDANGNYLFDFSEIEAFTELGFDAGSRPAKLFVHYVKNIDADEFDTGWLVGGKYGKASSPGSWELGYWYQDLEADAVLGLLTDSDFAGGGTDGSGHRFSAGYALGKGWKSNFTYFVNERDSDAESMGIGTERDYDRVQIDLSFKY